MTLRQLQDILRLNKNDVEGQMKVLGKDLSKLSVKEMEYIIKKEISVDVKPMYKKWIFKNKRLFRICADIEDLNGGEYSYFKQVLGDIQANMIDDQNNIIEVTSEEKVNKLFFSAHKLLSVFLIEKTFWKKKLSFQEKQDMLLSMDVNFVIPIVFFLSKRTESLQIKTTIYYLNQINKYLKEED